MTFVHPDLRPTAVWTGSGYFDIADPDPDKIVLAEVAKALAGTTRYNNLGPTSPFTVGQHLLLCDTFAETDQLRDPEVRLSILLHDAPEAIVGDMVQPLKRLCPQVVEIEDRVWRAFAVLFDVPRVMPRAVKHYDDLALASEKLALISPEAGTWPGLPPGREVPWSLRRMEPRQVAGRWEKAVTAWAEALANHRKTFAADEDE